MTQTGGRPTKISDIKKFQNADGFDTKKKRCSDHQFELIWICSKCGKTVKFVNGKSPKRAMKKHLEFNQHG